QCPTELPSSRGPAAVSWEVLAVEEPDASEIEGARIADEFERLLEMGGRLVPLGDESTAAGEASRRPGCTRVHGPGGEVLHDRAGMLQPVRTNRRLDAIRRRLAHHAELERRCRRRERVEPVASLSPPPSTQD